MAAMEGMAAGLPLLTSNVRGLNDFIQPDENGYACPPTDASCFAKAIETLMNSEEKRMRMGEYNSKAVTPYDVGAVSLLAKSFYEAKC